MLSSRGRRSWQACGLVELPYLHFLQTFSLVPGSKWTPWQICVRGLVGYLKGAFLPNLARSASSKHAHPSARRLTNFFALPLLIYQAFMSAILPYDECTLLLDLYVTLTRIPFFFAFATIPFDLTHGVATLVLICYGFRGKHP